MKGVAKCLTDKLMGLLDPQYIEKGGYDVVGDDLDDTGPQRIIQNIIINLPWHKPEHFEWMSRWLARTGFEQVGNLKGVGNKTGKGYVFLLTIRK